ncbi:YbbR-like domain-containing protein, partial [bacterium]|nr:YbbR-like domain-containing protein [bacterium]
MNRLGLKISCLVAALIIWMQVAATSPVEQDINLPLRVTGLASGLTYAGSNLPAEVRVRVTGSKLNLLRHKFFNHFVGEVRLDLSGRDAGPAFALAVDSGDIFTSLTSATVFPPTTVRVHIDRQDTLRVPVRLELSGSLPRDKGLVTPARATPDSVTLIGPERFLAPIPMVRTEPMDMSRVTASQERDLALRLDQELLHLEPDHVRVTLKIGPLRERTLANVPVIALVDAGRPEAGVSPPVADVKVRGVADSVATLTGERLLVTIPVGDRPEGIYSLPGQVAYPPWLQ